MAGRGRTGAPFDLVLLDDISNNAIVDVLRQHHSSQEMYTWIGPVLISVNPYTVISNLYTPATLNRYVGKKIFENPPHVYAVAENAYRNMVLYHSDEAVVITGESGAGKTENSKKVMEYVAALASKSKEVQRIKTQLLESNPMLEAFGNAKTVRNDNSSRFGKYMSILFKYGDPSGGKIQVYLLEKARVVGQLDTERNFHAFYQLLAGADSSTKSRLMLTSASDFRYTKGCISVKTIDDSSEFADTCKAMEWCGIQGEEQKDVWRVVAGVLHLGNVVFKDGPKDSSKAEGPSLPSAAQQLGISPQDLEHILTERTIATGNDSMQKLLDPASASSARDALAKSLYGKLFLYLVKKANETMHTEEFASSIGVLDIFGFEILGTNGFEQLCINYTNEKLHQLFVEQTLKGEQAVYASEGIPWQKIDYIDNIPLIQMIEKNGGMFALINEESIFPKGTDMTLFSKLKANIKDKEFSTPPKGTQSQFQLKHYAGVVVYDTEGMLEKNKDNLYPEMVTVLSKSINSVAAALFKEEALAQAPSKGRATGTKRPDTTCVQYKAMVSTLMADLMKTSLHYIRCIKPNDTKSAGVFQDPLVTTQALYLGLLENVKVRRAGYAFRMEYHRFVAKYKSTTAGHDGFNQDVKEGSIKVLKSAGISDYQVGKTMIFIKSPKSIFDLEDKKKDFLDEAASYLPPGDGLIAADKVYGLNNAFQRAPLMLVVGGNGFYLFNLRNGQGDGGAAAHHFPMDKIDSLSYNPDNGWVAIHTKPYPGKFDTDPMVQLAYVCENCYGQEVEDWVEILNTNMGRDFKLNKVGGSPPAMGTDGAVYKEAFLRIGDGAVKPPERGFGNRGGKKNAGGGGCCLIS
jgi:myosin-1